MPRGFLSPHRKVVWLGGFYNSGIVLQEYWIDTAQSQPVDYVHCRQPGLFVKPVYSRILQDRMPCSALKNEVPDTVLKLVSLHRHLSSSDTSALLSHTASRSEALTSI